MILRNLIPALLIAFLVMSSFCIAQHQDAGYESNKDFSGNSRQMTMQPGLNFPDYPILHLPDSYLGKQLPSKVDNSVFPYLRPVCNQLHQASCGQCAAVSYNFCYEINRLRNIPSNVAENQYPSQFTWNFMNASVYYGVGVSYFHSFEILRSVGCANEATFGPITMQDSYYWMSGYDKYFKAMNNRIKSVHSIPVNTISGLQTLKNWLNDHLDGSISGGLANFYIGLISFSSLPYNSPDPFKSVVLNWGSNATHALTIVGYNDSIRYDINNDGLFTNDLDINNDDTIDIRDWEIGGIKFVNSYGTSWANDGFCYALYSSLAMKYGEGGIWNNSVHVIEPDTAYHPLLAIKTQIHHTARGRVRLRAGVSTDTSAFYPEQILEFPIFNFQGGDNYMQGGDGESDMDIEIGLDITPLIGSTIQGKPSKFFLLVDEDDPDNFGEGIVKQFSVIGYDSIPKEYSSMDAPFAMINNSQSILSVLVNNPLHPITISPETINAVLHGSKINQQFVASNGEPPYEWNMKVTYDEIPDKATYQEEDGQKLVIEDLQSGSVACKLPFSFPYFGKNFDSIYPHTDGYLLFQSMNSPYPYLQDENLYLKQIQAIAACMSSEQYISNAGKGIWYKADSGKAEFTYKMGIIGYDTSKKTNFKITLFPDGRIRFAYGSFILPEIIHPVIGLSSGDGINFQYSQKNGKADFKNGEIVDFIPASFPGHLSLSESGWLSSDTIRKDFSANIQLIASDRKRVCSIRNYTLTTGPEIKYVIKAGNDNIIEPGENVSISIIANNKTTVDLNNLQMKLTSQDPFILIGDSVAVIQQIQAGQERLLPDTFNFHVSDSIPDDQLIVLHIELSWPGHLIESNLSVIVQKQIVEISGPIVKGQQCFRLNPGEKEGILMKLTQGGKVPGKSYIGKLTCNDPYISIKQSGAVPMEASNNRSCAQAEWTVQVNGATPFGHTSSFSFLAVSGQNDSVQKDFLLSVGKPSIMVIDLDGNNNSAIHLTRSINNIGLLTENQKVIDTNIFECTKVFLCLGVRTHNHTLSAEEGNLLEQFLQMGGNLYMEGGATFGTDTLLPIHEKFRVQGNTNSWYSPPDTLLGESGSFAVGIDFVYKGDKFKANNLTPLSPSTTLFTDNSTGFHFVIANDSGSYKTIASTIEFGGIFPFLWLGREALMMKYLDFFSVNLNPLAANYSSDLTETCTQQQVHFTSFCAGNPTLYHWYFEGGNPPESFEQEVDVSWVVPGVYDVGLTVSDSISTNTILKQDHVSILDCNSISEPNAGIKNIVFPNPTTGQAVLQTESDRPRLLAIYISDLSGKNEFFDSISIPAGTTITPLNLDNLSPGIYLMALQNENSKQVLKLVVQ